jgi:hypothetical protein
MPDLCSAFFYYRWLVFFGKQGRRIFSMRYDPFPLLTYLFPFIENR